MTVARRENASRNSHESREGRRNRRVLVSRLRRAAHAINGRTTTATTAAAATAIAAAVNVYDESSSPIASISIDASAENAFGCCTTAVISICAASPSPAPSSSSSSATAAYVAAAAASDAVRSAAERHQAFTNAYNRKVSQSEISKRYGTILMFLYLTKRQYS